MALPNANCIEGKKTHTTVVIPRCSHASCPVPSVTHWNRNRANAGEEGTGRGPRSRRPRGAHGHGAGAGRGARPGSHPGPPGKVSSLHRPPRQKQP